MEKPLFEESEIASEIPYKNNGQMDEIWSKIGKWPPKTLEKHCLQKVFASSFRKVGKPYKTNGDSIILITRERTLGPGSRKKEGVGRKTKVSEKMGSGRLGKRRCRPFRKTKVSEKEGFGKRNRLRFRKTKPPKVSETFFSSFLFSEGNVRTILQGLKNGSRTTF